MNLSEDQIVRLAQFIYEWSGIGEWRYIGTIHQTAYIEKAKDIIAWIEKEKYSNDSTLQIENEKLTKEVQRLRDINHELVRTHSTLVVENARQERAIWKFSGDPRAFKEE